MIGVATTTALNGIVTAFFTIGIGLILAIPPYVSHRRKGEPLNQSNVIGGYNWALGITAVAAGTLILVVSAMAMAFGG